MKFIKTSAITLAKASKANPLISTATILLYYVFFSILEMGVEILIFGDRFEHWLDPIFVIAFMAYSSYTAWVCAVINETEK